MLVIETRELLSLPTRSFSLGRKKDLRSVLFTHSTKERREGFAGLREGDGNKTAM